MLIELNCKELSHHCSLNPCYCLLTQLSQQMLTYLLASYLLNNQGLASQGLWYRLLLEQGSIFPGPGLHLEVQ